jgi:hypothetical protein
MKDRPMTVKLINTLFVAAVLFAGAAPQAMAWEKSFKGTQAQVVAACKGPGLSLGSPGKGVTSCTNDNNGTHVVCNDKGHCIGDGPGPMARVASTDVVSAVLSARAKVDLTAFGFDADGNSSVKRPPEPVKGGETM